MFKLLLITGITFFLCVILYPSEPIYLIDVQISLFFESIRSIPLNKFFSAMSDIGSIKFLLPLSLICGIFLFIRRRYLEIVLLFFILFSVRFLNELIKNMFKRERPNMNPVYELTDYSFPSGHAMNSIALYSLLCYFVLKYVKNSNSRRGILFISSLVILLIGVSRIYLGVHFFTDVIAGFSIGFAWFILNIVFFAKISRIFDKNRTV
ncbi:phosphatase PAP2 family protein [Metabacillus malikii]|uniref:Undecaprenyl-diphosphatase n=1 Tax=Metabacillus malikii TaxID=1504265 RepID=A0ABT9Z9F6_9BACI|nr:phosphatase PAP2 family protein [Metabacillus malikii]MDQ0228896.1 undecaprenyl-diphosphatase [Metabacillus malikii]